MPPQLEWFRKSCSASFKITSVFLYVKKSFSEEKDICRLRLTLSWKRRCCVEGFEETWLASRPSTGFHSFTLLFITTGESKTRLGGTWVFRFGCRSAERGWYFICSVLWVYPLGLSMLKVWCLCYDNRLKAAGYTTQLRDLRDSLSGPYSKLVK